METLSELREEVRQLQAAAAAAKAEAAAAAAQRSQHVQHSAALETELRDMQKSLKEKTGEVHTQVCALFPISKIVLSGSFGLPLTYEPLYTIMES